MTLLPLAHHLLNVADQEDPIWVPAEDAPRYDHSHWVGITLNLPSCEMLLLRVGGGLGRGNYLSFHVIPLRRAILRETLVVILPHVMKIFEFKVTLFSILMSH